MPEGDTISVLSKALESELAGKTLAVVELRGRGSVDVLRGQIVQRVESRGKHLIVTSKNGWSLKTHLGIHGDVHRYRRGQRWKLSPDKAVLFLETSDGVQYVWLDPAQAELISTGLLHAHPQLAIQGPDLLDPNFDLDDVLERALTFAHHSQRAMTIADLLMDQSVAAGIGNVYKSELLFLEGLDPWTVASRVPADALRRLYESARELLIANNRPGPRRTRPLAEGDPGGTHRRTPNYWVYGRTGRPCARCGAAIRSKNQGSQARKTYFCPNCQRT